MSNTILYPQIKIYNSEGRLLSDLYPITLDDFDFIKVDHDFMPEVKAESFISEADNDHQFPSCLRLYATVSYINCEESPARLSILWRDCMQAFLDGNRIQFKPPHTTIFHDVHLQLDSRRQYYKGFYPHTANLVFRGVNPITDASMVTHY